MSTQKYMINDISSSQGFVSRVEHKTRGIAERFTHYVIACCDGLPADKHQLAPLISEHLRLGYQPQLYPPYGKPDQLVLDLDNKGQTPRELASSKVPKGPHFRYAENILPREMQNDEKRSQSIIDRTQIIGLGSALITTLTFAAAFAVPGGYRADGTPTLAVQYAFDAFVTANTLAFTFSCVSIIYLMVAGLGADSDSIFSLLHSINFLALSARSLVAAFVFGMYTVLAPVEHKKAIVSCLPCSCAWNAFLPAC